MGSGVQSELMASFGAGSRGLNSEWLAAGSFPIGPLRFRLGSDLNLGECGCFGTRFIGLATNRIPLPGLSEIPVLTRWILEGRFSRNTKSADSQLMEGPGPNPVNRRLGLRGDFFLPKLGPVHPALTLTAQGGEAPQIAAALSFALVFNRQDHRAKRMARLVN